MNLKARIARGEGMPWRALKRTARMVLRFHLPVFGWMKPAVGLLYHLHVLGREALGWALRFFWYEPLFRSQCTRIGDEFRMERLPYMAGRGRIIIGSRVWMSGKSTIEFSNRANAEPELVIGEHSFIGHGCRFHIAEAVRVGRHCLLAGGVAVFDHDGHPLDAARRRDGQPTPGEGIKPVTIGDDVWIGTDAIILKGVTIGDRAIVGAGAVVTRDVPPDTVVMGNLAHVVKELAPTAVDRSASRGPSPTDPGNRPSVSPGEG
jgi:acetyltransferase-like isoleucine patch superfamily enzyme